MKEVNVVWYSDGVKVVDVGSTASVRVELRSLPKLFSVINPLSLNRRTVAVRGYSSRSLP